MTDKITIERETVEQLLEWIDQFPIPTSGATAWIFRLTEALAAQPATVDDHLKCGHHRSLAINSAETGEFLYCDLCDAKSRCRDAETMEEELRAALAAQPAEPVAMLDKFMVFDVESIGLHGEGFAVAWEVVDRNGVLLGEGCLSCEPAQCKGTDESRLWIAENVPPLEVTSPTPQHLRNTFWHEWRHWADQGAVLVADCAWPVEANFLSACIALNHAEREWQGPYPLHDLASVMLAIGGSPLAVTDRLPDEIPAHHPLMDARQSARQLVAALTTTSKGGA